MLKLRVKTLHFRPKLKHFQISCGYALYDMSLIVKEYLFNNVRAKRAFQVSWKVVSDDAGTANKRCVISEQYINAKISH